MQLDEHMTAYEQLKISVVIPTADRGDLLQRSIHSVFQQSVSALEVILVDNGVSNACFYDYGEGLCVRVIRTSPRIGPGRARNIGAIEAAGDLVAFLDDDDLWCPDYLEHVLQKFEKVEADAVLGLLMRQSEGAEAVPYKSFPDDPEKQRRIFYSNPGFGGQNLTVRRDVFLEFGGFDESMPASEDRDLAARMLLAGKVLVPQSKAVAILWDHTGGRARHSLLKGNFAFIKKHWRSMRYHELFRALTVLCKRYLFLALRR